MSEHESVPVSSPEAWQAHAVKPVRKDFEISGFSVADLSDDDVLRAALEILELGGGPDLVQIGIVLDKIRAEAKLAEALPAATVEPTPDEETSEESRAPKSKDCPDCVPIKVPYPSGWWVVHSKFCPTHPMVGANYLKIRPAVGRHDARTIQRLRAEHAAENARTGLPLGSRRQRSCDKCGGPTFGLPYCNDCRALLDIVKPREASA